MLPQFEFKNSSLFNSHLNITNIYPREWQIKTKERNTEF